MGGRGDESGSERMSHASRALAWPWKLICMWSGVATSDGLVRGPSCFGASPKLGTSPPVFMARHCEMRFHLWGYVCNPPQLSEK